MPSKDTNKLYTGDEILAKLERAKAQSSGELKSDIRAAIEDRKMKLRNK